MARLQTDLATDWHFLLDSPHTQVFLAPMAGLSDEAFRRLCRECGADMAYTEMVSAKGLSYANEKTHHLLDSFEGEDMVAVQLFGHEPNTLAAQAAHIEDEMEQHLAWIDINMGCPAKKIVSKGDGAALMRDPDLASVIVRAVSCAINHPVTVKFRRGWCENESVGKGNNKGDDKPGDAGAVEFALRMEDAGARGVCVHGRYALQFYRGHADWNVIADVKHAVSIPVIGNGDVRSAADAVALVEQTGCDHVMIARGAEGNPWIFSQVKAALAGKPLPASPTLYERIEMARRHAHLLAEHDGRFLVRMRKHAMAYVSGLPGASAAREKITKCTTLADFDNLFDELEQRGLTHAT